MLAEDVPPAQQVPLQERQSSLRHRLRTSSRADAPHGSGVSWPKSLPTDYQLLRDSCEMPQSGSRTLT